MRLSVIARQATGLLSAGAIAGLGLLLLASGRAFNLTPEVLAALLGAITWQVLGVTVCKLGSDQIVLAEFFGTSKRIDLTPVIRTRVIPFALAFSLASCTRYSPLISVLLFFIIVFDVAALIYQAKLTAELRTGHIFFSNFLNYPVFLILLYVWGLARSVSMEAAVGLFLLSSTSRCAYLKWLLASERGEATPVHGDLQVGLYQGVNYWLFRGAQIVVGMKFLALPALVIANLFFFWKAIELINKVNGTLAPLVFKILAPLPPARRPLALIAMSAAYASVFIAFYVGAHAFLGKEVPAWMLVAFLTSAALNLPLNYLTFESLRRAQTTALLRRGIPVCVLAGIVFFALAMSGFPLLAVVSLTPLQLILMTLALAVHLRMVGAPGSARSAVS